MIQISILTASPPEVHIARTARPTDPIVLGCDACTRVLVLHAGEVLPHACLHCGAPLCRECAGRYALGDEQRARATKAAAIATAIAAASGTPENEAADVEQRRRPSRSPNGGT